MSVLSIGREGEILVWTLSRPEAKNSLSLELLDALVAAAKAVPDDARAVVLTGAGDSFCAGGDLRELRDLTSEHDILPFVRVGVELCRRLAELPIPVIAALPGPAFGGGAELAVACDMRVAERRARIAFKQVRMGVSTAWGTIPRLAALVGRGAAARLLLTGDEVTAERAQAMGLVEEVTEDGDALDAALALARSVAHGGKGAVAHIKLLLDAPAATLAEEEESRFLQTWTGAEHRAAVEAYFRDRNRTS